MKKFLILLLLCALLLSACAIQPKNTIPATEISSQPKTTEEPLSLPETTTAIPTSTPTTETQISTTETTASVTEPPDTTVEETEPIHSELYIPGVDVEDVIVWFQEVCLDAEFSSNGNPSVIQKWMIPLRYQVYGEPTEEDLQILESFCELLNSIPGFPGIQEAQNLGETTLKIHFCSQEDLISILGDQYWGVDGGVVFWYQNDAIYDATICCRTDLDQEVRNSVIQEELYNGLGPVQDTDLRPDSLIYSGYSFPQEPTAVDMLLLKLLYHPDILCGMNLEACEAVIRQLYY